jgi:hypothetical protein
MDYAGKLFLILLSTVLVNNFVLDFYYSADLDWIIWSDITEEDGSKIVEYHFLSPKGSMKDWLSSL